MRRYYRVSGKEAEHAYLFNLYNSTRYLVSIVGCLVVFRDGHLETIVGVCKKGQFRMAPYLFEEKPHVMVGKTNGIPASKPLDELMIAPGQATIEIDDYIITDY